MSAPPHHPLTADDLRPGDPYELSDGRLVECLPTGRRGGRSNLVGGAVLDADPAVEAAGVDVGISPRKDLLRAPDISVGDLPNEPGWATSAPPLAVEYADTGQDEAELQTKIDELLSEGTRLIWVVRLQGQPRVEIYEASPGESRNEVLDLAERRSRSRTPRRPARVAHPGEQLVAPGILQNPVPVEALYDREAAHEATLRNLLQRKGYSGLDAVRSESIEAGRKEGFEAGRKKGREEALRTGIRDLCELLCLTLSPERDACIEAMTEEALLALREHLKRHRSLP